MFIAHEQRGSPRRSSSGLPLCVAPLPLHVHRPPRAVLAVVAQCSACVRPRCHVTRRQGMGKLVRRPHAPPQGAVIFFLCASCVCVSCARRRIRTPHPYSVLDTQRAPASSQPTAGAACGASPYTVQHLLGPLLARTRGMPVCRACARARCPVFPRPLLSSFPPRAPASSQPSSGGAACGASPHTAHAFGPPPSTRGMLVLGMRPRAVPRVFPPSSFHVPPAWSVSSSLGSLLTYAPVPFPRVACPPGRP